LALAVLTAAFVCLPATAEGDGVTTYRAMLVGIDNYASSALAGCVTDANRMLATLQTANEAGAIYQQPEIRTNLKAAEIASFLGEMTAWGIDDDDVTFWYFAGHGFVSDKDVVSIVGTDAKTLRIDRLKDALDEVPGTKIVVLDCRYADSLIEKSGKTAKDVLQKFNTSVADIFLADPEHYFVLSGATLASSVGSAAADAHGLVTNLLTAACGYDYQAQKPGDLLGDADQNGAVSLSEAKAYIDAAVAQETGAPQVQVAVSPADTSYPVLARRANTEVLKVDMTKSEAEVATNYTLHLEASVSPANASRPGLTWSSSDLGVATVDDTGTVTGVRAGSARIVAMSDNGLAAGCDITVRDVTFAESIEMGISKLVMGEGTSYKMPLDIEPSDADEAITWATDDATVAAVDKAGNISAKGLGDAVITATTERGIQANVNVKVVNKGKEVTAIRMEKEKVALYEGNALQLEYKLEPKSPADGTITWTSSDPSVADMNASGLLVAEKPGVITMTATATSGISASVQVTVKGAELSISPNPVTLKKGATQKLTAKILPSGLILTTTWKTDDPTIATVDEEGTVTAVANGLTAVTASLESGVTQTVMVSVVDVPAKAIKMNKGKLKMTVGGQQALKVKISPANATIRNAFWTSSNESVATVDENGKITAMAPGKVVITAKTHNGKKARCLLQVDPVALKSIKLSRSSATLTVGIGDENTLQLTADTNPVSAGASAVKWGTSNKKVATVDANGLVTALAPGKAVIRALSGRVKADCKITVTGNEAVYGKPVTGKEKKVYVSARHIYYKNENLVVEVYFANKSGKVAKLPYAGKLILTLKDGQVFELKDVAKGKNSLMNGKAAKADYKISLADRPELEGLDLRGASATILSAADQAAQGDADLNGDATVEPSTDPGDAGDLGDEIETGTDALDTTEPV
jgi:uncharacterized protein YjdB